jgi:hypothetical protein
MRRSLIRLATILGALTPVVCAAAFTSPSTLFYAMATQRIPMDFSYEFHGRYEDYYASAWMSGAATGGLPAEMTANTRMTLDIAGHGGTFRAKMQVRIKDGTAYLLVEKVEGAYEDDAMKIGGEVIAKKWVSFSVATPDMQEIPEAALSPDVYATFDEFFHLQTTENHDGTIMHTLTLRREFVKTILDALRDMSSSSMYTGSGEAPHATIQFAIQTDRQDNMRMFNFDADMGNAVLSLKGTGKSTLRTAPVTVQIPTNVVSIEDAMNAADLPGMMFPGMGASEWEDEWETVPHEDWEEPITPLDEEEWWPEEENSDPWMEEEIDTWEELLQEEQQDCAKDLSRLRRGECGIERTRSR